MLLNGKTCWCQSNLWPLLLSVLVAGVGGGWCAVRVQQARRRQEAVDAIVKSGGEVQYDYQMTPGMQPQGHIGCESSSGTNSSMRSISPSLKILLL